MAYIYETHLHTSEGSRCAKNTAREQLERMKRHGYTGVCITDHFMNNASCTVDPSLPWDEQIDSFCESYRIASEIGKEIGIDVFFGWEYSYRGTDFLTYGLDAAWLKRHPDLLSLSTAAYCDLVRAEGGVVIQAHPFREAKYIEMIRLLPRNVDGVEILNACRTDFENLRACQFAEVYGLVGTAGSDIHRPIPRLCGMASDEKIPDSVAFAAAIKSGKMTPITVFDRRPDGNCDA